MPKLRSVGKRKSNDIIVDLTCSEKIEEESESNGVSQAKKRRKDMIAKVKTSLPASLSITSVKTSKDTSLSLMSASDYSEAAPMEHPRELRKLIMGKLHSEITVEVQESDIAESVRLTRNDFIGGMINDFEIFLSINS